ncbi:hypothetical protein RUA4292_01758 [Ruegeria atlantica]|uniref:Uncharacterized protein n=1 Tax=Ruegeria atlantica TaxID=81569 RepID=A0A0P1F0L9_9RHOB|nr:hypothetical protein RUA4292_01758 [Ruegeria atlantica]
MGRLNLKWQRLLTGNETREFTMTDTIQAQNPTPILITLAAATLTAV